MTSSQSINDQSQNEPVLLDSVLLLNGKYFEKKILNKDFKEAIARCRKDALNGDAEAQYALGNIYEQGIFITKDVDKAIEWFEKAAEQNHAASFYRLACQVPLEDAENIDMAADLYCAAASQGHVDSQFCLGFIYYSGFAAEVDYPEAFKWFTMAANEGHMEAQFYLGEMLYKGESVPQDYKAAFRWFKAAAQQKHEIASFRLGEMFYHGNGVLQDNNKAIEWFNTALCHGKFYDLFKSDENAHDNKNILRRPRFDIDYSPAIECFKQAAEQGNAVAQNRLGKMYYKGIGVSRNYKKAHQYFLKAAGQGNLDAINNLGQMYESGHDCTQDKQKAINCYLKAAQAGHLRATTHLCSLYTNILDEIKSDKETYNKTRQEFLDIATTLAEQGNESAQYWIGFFLYYEADDLSDAYQQGLIDDVSEEDNQEKIDSIYQQAVYWLMKAAIKGDDGAQYYLGLLYKDGLGIPQNEFWARYWLIKSANQGWPEAKVALKRVKYG